MTHLPPQSQSFSKGTINRGFSRTKNDADDTILNVGMAFRDDRSDAKRAFTIGIAQYYTLESALSSYMSRGIATIFAGVTTVNLGINMFNNNTNSGNIILIIAKITMVIGLLTILSSLVYFIFPKIEYDRRWTEFDNGVVYFDKCFSRWKTAMLTLHVTQALSLFLIFTIFVGVKAF